MRIAFYKGSGRIVDRLIKWWTNGPYSHCELEVYPGVWYSADAWNNVVRMLEFTPDPEKWDFLDVPVTESQMMLVRLNVTKKIGRKYDWLGIFLCQVIPLGIHSKLKWFCSETITDDLHCLRMLRDQLAIDLDPSMLYEHTKCAIEHIRLVEEMYVACSGADANDNLLESNS